MATSILTIEYLDEDGHLARTEQLRGTAFTLRVQTGGLQVVQLGAGAGTGDMGDSTRQHPDAIASRSTSTLGAARGHSSAGTGFAVWGWVAVLGAVFGLLTAWGEWVSHNPDQAGKNYVANALVYVVGLAAWAAFWAMLGKVFAKRADFGMHLRLVLGFGVVFELLTYLLHFLAFSLAWYVLGRMDVLLLIAALCALVWAHLRLIVSQERLGINRLVMLGIGAVAISMTLWTNHRKSDTVLNTLHSPYLYAPALQLRQPRTSEDFFGQASGLEAVLKTKATEVEPGEDVLGVDSGE
jgi:hypothetical protein